MGCAVGLQVTPVSTYRFASVTANGPAGLRVALRGKPAEKVVLLYAVGHPVSCKSSVATIGSDGAAIVTLE